MKLSETYALCECREPGRIVRDIWPDRPEDIYSGMTHGEMCKVAIQVLGGLVKKFIVVVTPGNRQYFHGFHRDFQNRILPGLAGNMMRDRIDDVDAWRTLAMYAEDVTRYCNTDTCYIDLESALDAYWRGVRDYAMTAVSEAIRKTVGKSSLKFLFYQPQFLSHYAERSTAIVKAFCDGMKSTDSLAPGFGSCRDNPQGRADEWSKHLLISHDRCNEQLLVSMFGMRGRTPSHTPKSVLDRIGQYVNNLDIGTYIVNLPAADCVSVAEAIAGLASGSSAVASIEGDHPMITSRRIVAKYALGFRKMLIAQPVSPAPAYLELGPVVWANATNGGGGQPIPMRQVGNTCVCRVTLPVATDNYWIIPEIGIGELYGSHALEGLNGHDIQAFGAAWNDSELGPMTIKKRCIAEPRMIQIGEMGAWMDYVVPMLGEAGPENVFVVNLHPYRILAS